MDLPIWRLPGRYLSYMVDEQGTCKFYHLNYGLDYQWTINRASTAIQAVLWSTIKSPPNQEETKESRSEIGRRE